MGGAGSEGTAACSDESVSSFMSSMTEIERNTWVDRREGRDGRDGREEPADSPAPSSPSRPIYVYAATSTLICRGLASSRSGSRTVSTPLRYSAATLPVSTV